MYLAVVRAGEKALVTIVVIALGRIMAGEDEMPATIAPRAMPEGRPTQAMRPRPDMTYARSTSCP
ncbi:hypothetical protein ASE49_02030 [Novosphingobium sp. Leaf2]|nr:hypothetical protein ASE49_02030 [Novosphingobium sp. Leaf2]